jgi:diguanylate cyclase (GGDEF)-like protein/PAS domain S-box-containing protein
MISDKKPFQPMLPARIAGIAFWGLVFIGFVVAVFLLHETESEIEKQNISNAHLLAYDLEEILEQFDSTNTLTEAQAHLSLRINGLRDVMGYNAVHLNSKENSDGIMFGMPGDNDEVISRTITYYPRGLKISREVSFSAFFPNIKIVVSEMRKNMLLSIGAAVFIFGFLLQRILKKVLTVPFLNMVRTAEEFSLGNEAARFDESQQDEFGYLGSFINRAIESVMEHQEKLVIALERVSKSEMALNLEKERAEVTLYSIADSVITVDIDSCVLFINPAAEKMLAISNEEATGKAYNDLVNVVIDSFQGLEGDLLKECFDTGEIVKFPDHASIINNDTSLIAVEASIAPMKSDTGDIMGAVIVIQDVSNTRKLTRQLSYQASHDMLTGLYNRRKFEERLAEALLNVVEEKRKHVLLYLDLDQFKIVNDTCGHVAGDELLQQLPVLFHKVFRASDLIARLGGDEFGVLLENCNLNQAAIIADKVREQIKDFRFVWEEKTFEIGVSIGVVAINEDNADMAHIMSSADIACYAAKDAGRNRVHIYEASDEAVSERYGEMHWTARITRAMEEGRFRLYKQVIVDVSRDTTDHIEVLLRMIDENGKIIPPGAFLPAAERYNLMVGIDRWVISEVFKSIAEGCLCKSCNGEFKTVSVNLSGDSLSDESLLPFIISEKEKHNVPLECICFEITETVAISNLTRATLLIDELTRYGCRFALDDFGSGLSSFAYLKTLPVHYLKIDGSFVRDVSRDDIDKAMVRSIQQVGEAMNLLTIAEGVEDEATLNILRELGVDYAQGYYLGRPEPLTID